MLTLCVCVGVGVFVYGVCVGVCWCMCVGVCVCVCVCVCGMILTGPQLQYQEKSVPLSLSPLQASDRLGFILNPAVHTDSPVTNRPSHDKARRFYCVIKRN